MAVVVVNEKELNLSTILEGEKRDPNEVWALEQIAEIRKIKSFRFYNRKPLQKNNLMFKQRISIDLTGTRLNPKTGIPEKWKISPGPLYKNGITIYPRKVYQMENNLILTPDKGDNNIYILFFLHMVNLGQFGYVIENKQVEAESRAQTRILRNKVETIIYQKLLITEVQQIAYRYNLSNIEDKGEAELRNELFDYIEAQHKKNDTKIGFQSFLDEFQGNMLYPSLAAKLNKATKDKIVEYNRDQKNIKYVGSNLIICQIPPSNYDRDKEEYVTKFLFDHEKERNIFLGACVGIFDQITEQQKELQTELKNQYREESRIFKENPILENVSHISQLKSYMTTHDLLDKVVFPEEMKDLEEKKAMVKKFEDEVKLHAPQNETQATTA